MNLLGIRVEPQRTTFVVIKFNDDKFNIINCELIKVPAALDFPEKLKYIRNCVLDILREYKVSIAAIRIAESNSRNLNVTRLHIEGVIQEAFSSSDIDKYFTGRKRTISSRLGVKSTEFNKIISGETEYPNIINWDSLTNKNAREAALVVIGAMK